MEKTSLSEEEFINKITESELGVLLLKKDEYSDFCRNLLEDSSCKKTTKACKWNHQTFFSVTIYPVLLEQSVDIIKEAFSEMLSRWLLVNGKANGEDPKTRRRFQSYLEQIGYWEADYIVMLRRE